MTEGNVFRCDQCGHEEPTNTSVLELMKDLNDTALEKVMLRLINVVGEGLLESSQKGYREGIIAARTAAANNGILHASLAFERIAATTITYDQWFNATQIKGHLDQLVTTGASRENPGTEARTGLTGTGLAMFTGGKWVRLEVAA